MNEFANRAAESAECRRDGASHSRSMEKIAMRQFKLFSFALCLSCVFLASGIPNISAGQSDPLIPQLGEARSFYQKPAAGAQPVAEPAWAAEGRGSVHNLKMYPATTTLADSRKYDLDKPPMRHYWWNYPLYAAVGFPRDLVDGLFGAASVIPIINIATTGAMYEIVPSQVLTRNWHDWHPWPLYKKINRNGHGWLDGRWGYFSNFHYTTLKKVDEQKLERWKTHNQAIDQQLSGVNKKVSDQNAQIAAQRVQYLRDTRQLFEQGKYQTVIQRLVAYREIDPLNNDARAMLAAALIEDLPNIAERDWADQTLSDLIWGSSRTVLIPVREELASSTRTLSAGDSTDRYLVAVNMQIGNYGQALSAAKNLVAANPGNVTYLRLQFEAALAGGDATQIDEAAKAIEQIAGNGSVAALHARGREALAARQPLKAIEIYERLVKMEPDNPRFHYLLAMSLIERGQDTGEYQKGAALSELNKAADHARTSEEKQFYNWVRDAAGTVRGSR